MFKPSKQPKPEGKKHDQVKKPRKFERQSLWYYLPVYDNDKEEILGHLVDLSPAGMMLDCKWNIPTDQHYNLRLELMDNHADKASIDLIGCCKWCHQDKIQAYIWNAGFEIVNIAEEDLEIIKDIADKYSDKHRVRPNE